MKDIFALADSTRKRLDELVDRQADIAERIDEIQTKADKSQAQLDHSIVLPLDADNVPIHMEDILHSDEIGIDFVCQGLCVDKRGGHEHWTVCYKMEDGISDWTAARRCHHVNPKTYSDILESFVHAYNLFMYASPSVSEFKSKEELFAHYIHKLEEVGR